MKKVVLVPALPNLGDGCHRRVAKLVDELGEFQVVNPAIFSTNAHRHGATTLSRHLKRGAFFDDRFSSPDFIRKAIAHKIVDLPMEDHMVFLVGKGSVPRLVREIMIKRHNHPVDKIPGVSHWDGLLLDLSIWKRSRGEFLSHISTDVA